VVVHGTIDDVVVYIDKKEIHLDHRRLALYIKKSGAKYKRIRLVSCKTGMHPKGVAQHLANKLGVEVIAPTHILHVNEDGTHAIRLKKESSIGPWETFKPAKSGFRFSKAREPEPENAAARWRRERAERAGSEQAEDNANAEGGPAAEAEPSRPRSITL